MSLKQSTVNVKISCPACNKKGHLKVNENMIKNSNRGITAINVIEDIVCEHSFVAYIDRNLTVRDCFVCDFKIELPKVEIKSELPIVTSKEYDIDIIKLNLLPSLMVNVLKGIFMDKKIAIISDNEFIFHKFLEFFRDITLDSFNLELISVDRMEYRKNKKQYKEFLVLDGNLAINDKDKIINEKVLKIEAAIVQKFFAEPDPKICIILIRNEMTKIHILVQALIDFNNSYSKKNPFTLKQILDFYEKEHNLKMQVPFLEFLENIVIKNYNVELHRTDKIIDFFGVL